VAVKYAKEIVHYLEQITRLVSVLKMYAEVIFKPCSHFISLASYVENNSQAVHLFSSVF
jgi:hypothetical protein